MKNILQVLIPIITLSIGIFIGKEINAKSNTDSDSSFEKKSVLEYIEFQPLIIKYSDTKCGEWGGNVEKIKIERKDYGKPLNALYTYEKIDCSDPYNEKSQPNITKRKKVILNKVDEKLVLESILELVEIKLGRENIPSHSGIWNSVIIGDSTLIIEDFPSEFIENFGRLRNEILKK